MQYYSKYFVTRSIKKMYNGIGVPSARGSGTNGYVVKSLAHITKSGLSRSNASGYNSRGSSGHASTYLALQGNGNTSVKTRRTSHLVYEHLSRRDIEKELLIFEDSLRDNLEEGEKREEEIQEKLEKERARLLHDYEKRQAEIILIKEGQIDKKKGMEAKFRKAFDISDKMEQGRAFQFEELAREKQEKNLVRSMEKSERYRR